MTIQLTSGRVSVTTSGAVTTPVLSAVASTTLGDTSSLMHVFVASGTAATTSIVRLRHDTTDVVNVLANGLVKAARGVQVLATTTTTANVVDVTGGLQVMI